MNNQKLAAFLLAVVLSGCTVIPGPHLPTSDKEVVGSAEEEVLEQVEVHPISASLVKQLRADEVKGPVSNPILDKEIAGYKYRIGKGDILNITVWDHPELTIPAGQYRSSSEAGNWVRSDGKIFYPYIGEVYVEGKTLEEVRDVLAKRLSKYLEKPQLDVNVAAFRSHKVFITGEVGEPGNIPVTNIPMTLLDAINQVGGFTENADWQRVTLHRQGKDETLSMKALLQQGVMTEDRLLLPGDIAHIPSIEDRRVYVMGAVKSPQTLPIGRNGLSLTESLSNVEGLNENIADATGVFVIRARPKESEKIADLYQLNLSDATAMVLGVDFPLQADDVVYVTTAPISRWARLINQIFPTLVTIGFIEGLVTN